MRTTLDIDDDVLQAAKEIGRAEGKTAGQVLSELARRALTTPTQPGLAEEHSPYDEANRERARKASWHTLPDREGVVVTPEMIERIQDELDIEDATPWDHETDEPRKF